MRKTSCYIIVILICCGGLTLAETDSMDDLNLKAGTLVRIEKADGALMHAKWNGLKEDRLSIYKGQSERFLAKPQISKIYRLELKSRKQGAIRGMKWGAIVGAGISVFSMIELLDEDIVPFASFVFFMPISVGSGALFGSMAPGYRPVLIYEREPLKTRAPIRGVFVIRF
jgi:hypothetical protein